MPSLPIRLAILECDTPLPLTKSQYGGYGGVFESLLLRGARSLGEDVIDAKRDLVITKFHVEGDDEGKVEYPDLESVEGVLLTGSRHDSFASPPWILRLVSFTALALAHPRVRVIGVCFGHQIVGRALGAKVGRNEKGWEAAVNDVTLSDVGRKVFGVRERLALHQMHRDVIHNLPTSLSLSHSPSSNHNSSSNQSLPISLLASSPTCEIQGLYTPHKLLTVQGHPEFNREIMTEILETRHKTGIFDDSAFEKYSGMVGRGHDGVIVAEAFLRFLLEE